MTQSDATATREALQELFGLASARRAERRKFVRTLRQILELRLSQFPLLLIKVDRRVVSRDR
jgi:hypothetical protein